MDVRAEAFSVDTRVPLRGALCPPGVLLKLPGSSQLPAQGVPPGHASALSDLDEEGLRAVSRIAPGKGQAILVFFRNENPHVGFRGANSGRMFILQNFSWGPHLGNEAGVARETS